MEDYKKYQRIAIIKRKIAIIGPAYPYRGGIAQYTDSLQSAMVKNGTESTLYSFRRLYPGWLYPGKSDKEEGLVENRPNTNYILDVYSPFTVLRLCRDIEKKSYDAVIITWWTLFWQPSMAYVAHRLSQKGIKTIFLCHNLYDHDGSPLKQKISKWLLGSANGYIVHSTDEEDALRKYFPDKPVLRRVLPVYSQFPKPTKTLKKRGRLELLFFGFIRPYKGLDVLLAALAKLNDDQVHLTIVGEYWGDDEDFLMAIKAKGLRNIETHLDYVSMEDAANYFERADAVVLPYLSATGSAVLSVAYFYKKPVIASAVGGLGDGVNDGRTGWLVAPGSSEDLADTIKNLDRNTGVMMAKEIEHFCEENNWKNMARAIAEYIGDIKN